MIQSSTILKNQNRTIILSLEQDEKNTANIELKSFKVQYDNGTFDEFEADEDAFAKNTKKNVALEPKISLFHYLERVKRDFYKSLIQSKYNEIENFVVLSGAGSSVGICKEHQGLPMSGL